MSETPSPPPAALPTAPGRTARPGGHPRTARGRSSRVHRRPHPGDAPGVRHHPPSQRGHERTSTPAKHSRSCTAPAAAPHPPRRCRTAPPTRGRTLHHQAQAHLPALTRGSAAAPSSAPTFFCGTPGRAARLVNQRARPSAAPRHAVPTLNRTASAATRAGLPPTAVTARTAPSRRSLLHRRQTCRGGGMGADQVVRRPQRLGPQPRRKQRMSGYRHRVIAKPGQDVDSPPVCR